MVRIKEIAGMVGSEGEDNATASLQFDVLVESGDTQADVRNAIAANTPTTFDGLSRNKYSWREEEDSGRQLVTVEYSQTLPESTLRRGFDATGGTVRVFASYATASFPRPSRTAPNFRNMIGIRDGDPEGVDKTIPALKLNYSYRWPKNVITNAYAKSLAAMVGTTNTATFDTYGPGELLFLGASGEIVPDVTTTIRYMFAASADVSGLTIADITGIAKAGHDYLWIAYEEEADTSAKKKIRRPLAAYVERVYDRSNFGTFGII